MSNIEQLRTIGHPLVRITRIGKWAISIAPVNVHESPERDADGQRCVTKGFSSSYTTEQEVIRTYTILVDWLNALERSWMLYRLAGVTKSDHDPHTFIAVISISIKPTATYYRAP